MKYNDYELLDFISENNEEANEILYDKYRPIIISLAKRMISFCPNSGIEMNDLIQEGMIALNHAIGTFDDSKNATFYTYALTCIRGRLVSEVIKSQRLKNKFLNNSVSLDEEANIDRLFGDNSYNPEKILINYESNKDFIDKVNNVLTDYEQQVFELKINNFTYREIAEILDRSPKAIDNAIQRIKTKIKNLIELEGKR